MLFWMLIIDILLGLVLKFDLVRYVLLILATLVCWYWHGGCVYGTAKKAMKDVLKKTSLDFKGLADSLSEILKSCSNNDDNS